MLKMLRILLLCLFCFGIAKAQLHVSFLLESSKADTFYFAGNINNWNPAHPDFRFSPGGRLDIIATAGDILSFKITRGSWNKVESGVKGEDIGNRSLKILSDTIIYLNIKSWKDDFSATSVKIHTASPHVAILDTAYNIPELSRTRTIRMYLPPDYGITKKRYPVLYMMDGQNCFDEYTGNFGEWQVDETFDRFFDSCKKSMIVVAIDHGGDKRLLEYNPYDNERFGKGEGIEFASFLANRLKPFIDSSFRTLPDRKHTSVAGSSLGGLISLYALLAYPGIYGNAGIFSPAFWVATPLYDEARDKVKALKQSNIFFYAGGRESKTMVSDATEMRDIFLSNRKIRTVLNVDEEAQHNEAAWRKWFPVFLNWIMK